ncbi:PREDICTED: double-strand break repair protein MRE11-like [Rhagoletis zephyria]|uniref:double-strand break repair protein MRE11-like n=1 Tax=Rhagoletis zephyria TaxID=28612 RepID=UPI0008117682|nr:PREDICTED: double-strand break repair protein MRE11-like [Rhagoletis zephyria]
MSEEVDTEDVLRIMVATDNHLGYAEKNAVRGDDSFIAFEELLELAVQEDVDFILLGGDLFHDAVPSQNTLHNCMKLLRRYTFGDKPINIELLSDQAVNFHNAVNETVNYEDPNLNVAIPVFSIHGNHDDPSGFGRLSSLDLLSTTGLVNYFGRWTDLTKVNINPVLLRKGQTQLALYGLSHIHDARLRRLFEDFKVNMEYPSSEEGEWFHLMVLHQNHADRGPKSNIPEEMLPDFLHLIIWGHEHDCHIEPQFNAKRNFYVSQPGSSVATSLAEGEALKKHVGLLEIHKTRFQMKPMPLQTVRPFVFDSVDLSQIAEELKLDEGDVTNKVIAMAKERVEDMIIRSKEQLTGHPKQPKLPLIRLRIIFSSEEQMFNAIRFGQSYNEQVANPADMILFKKVLKRVKGEYSDGDKEALRGALDGIQIDSSSEMKIENFIERYFQEIPAKRQLKVLSPKILSEICNRLVEKGDVNAAEGIIKHCKYGALEHLMESLPADDEVEESLEAFNKTLSLDDIINRLDNLSSKVKANVSDTSLSSTSSKSRQSARGTSSYVIPDDDENDSDVEPLAKKATKKQAKTGNNFFLDDNDDSDNDAGPATAKTINSTRGKKTTKAETGAKTIAGRGRGRGRGRGAAPPPTRTTRQALDVSVNSTRSTLLESLANARSRRGVKNAPVIDISDSE